MNLNLTTRGGYFNQKNSPSSGPGGPYLVYFLDCKLRWNYFPMGYATKIKAGGASINIKFQKTKFIFMLGAG